MKFDIYIELQPWHLNNDGQLKEDSSLSIYTKPQAWWSQFPDDMRKIFKVEIELPDYYPKFDESGKMLGFTEHKI